MTTPKFQLTAAERADIFRAIYRNEQARFLHRLHIVLLVSAGCSYAEIGRYFGENSSTILRWVKRFREASVAGLKSTDRPGRPKSLGPFQWSHLEADLGKAPRYFGFETPEWDGPTIAEHLRRYYGIDLGLRQCQRVLRQMVKNRA